MPCTWLSGWIRSGRLFWVGAVSQAKEGKRRHHSPHRLSRPPHFTDSCQRILVSKSNYRGPGARAWAGGRGRVPHRREAPARVKSGGVFTSASGDRPEPCKTWAVSRAADPAAGAAIYDSASTYGERC